MKVLIVEDDEFKLTQLAKFVGELLDGVRIIKKRSQQSGVKAVIETVPDLVLLDMSLPTFDIGPTEAGYSTEFFAGRNILRELCRYKIASKVIVITQFEQFGEGDEATTLDELRKKLEMQFPDNYIATIYYHPSQEDWKIKLEELIKPFTKC